MEINNFTAEHKMLSMTTKLRKNFNIMCIFAYLF